MLEKIFDNNNWVMKALEVACDLILLNILTFCFCIPVVTAGASFTALNDVIWHRIRGEESYIVKGFLSSFRLNLKKGTLLGLFFGILIMILWVDYLVVGKEFPFFRVAVIVAAVCLLSIMLYTFALLSRYENTMAGTLKNAVLLAVGFFPKTVLMLVMVIIYLAAILYFFKYAIPVILLFGFSLPCYLCGLIYNSVFQSMDQQREDGKEE